MTAKKRTKPLIMMGCCLLVIALLCATGAIWKTAGEKADMRKYPPMGQLVDVFDCKMHVFSAGAAQNRATVVLLSGWGTVAPVIDFYPLWSRLEEYAQVVVLERPGYGWSEVTGRPRTVQNMMEEDRLALSRAGFSPPYYLAAHSVSGFEAAAYAANYPDEVAGVILIDATVPENVENPPKMNFLDKYIGPIATPIGLVRLIDFIAEGTILNPSSYDFTRKYADASFFDMERALARRNDQNKNIRREFDCILENAIYVQEECRFPENMPLLNLVQSDITDFPGALKVSEAWVEQSSKAQTVFIDGDHYLHHEGSDRICEAIRKMIDNEA